MEPYQQSAITLRYGAKTFQEHNPWLANNIPLLNLNTLKVLPRYQQGAITPKVRRQYVPGAPIRSRSTSLGWRTIYFLAELNTLKVLPRFQQGAITLRYGAKTFQEHNPWVANNIPLLNLNTLKVLPRYQQGAITPRYM